jgi:hypothetical protein
VGGSQTEAAKNRRETLRTVPPSAHKIIILQLFPCGKGNYAYILQKPRISEIVDAYIRLTTPIDLDMLTCGFFPDFRDGCFAALRLPGKNGPLESYGLRK